MTARHIRVLAVVGVGLWLMRPVHSLAQQTRDAIAVARGSATLNGTVVADDGGGPIAYALVTVRGVVPAFSATASTDAAGHFTVTGLPVEDVTVTATKAVYLTGFYGSHDRVRGPAVPFALAGASPTEITIRLVRGGVIAGVVTGVTGRPQPGVEVSARASRLSAGTRQIIGGPLGQGGLTDDRGRYRIWGLTPGEYVVEATPATGQQAATETSDAEIAWATAVTTGARSAPPPGPGHPVQLAPVYFPGVSDGAEAVPVVIGAGEEHGGIDLALTAIPTGDLSGTLVGIDGQSVPRQPVMLETVLGRQTATTDGAGRFLFHGVAPGTATVSARENAQGGQPSSRAATSDAWAQLTVTVSGRDDPSVTLALQPGMTVSGRVAFESVPPADRSRAIIVLTAAADDARARQAQAAVAADGSFAVTGLAPGHYVLRPALPEPPSPESDAWIAKSVVWQGQDLLDGALELQPGQDVQGLSVVFSQRLADLNGSFFDSAGHLVAGYDVVLFATDSRFWTPDARRTRFVLLGRDGHFDFKNLPAGEYCLAAVTHVDSEDLADPDWLNAVVPLSLHVTLADGEHKVQDIRLGK